MSCDNHVDSLVLINSFDNWHLSLVFFKAIARVFFLHRPASETNNKAILQNITILRHDTHRTCSDLLPSYSELTHGGGGVAKKPPPS